VQRDLVIRAQDGDQDAFTALVAGSVDRLFNVARLILRSNDLAGDAVQEAVLRAGTAIRGLRDPDRFDAWTCQLLVRACYRSGRHARSRRAMDIGHISIVGARSPDAERSVAGRDWLERGFKRLSLDRRAVLVVHHFLELRDHEAEEVLGIRRGTLESRLNRATSALGSALEAEERQGLSGTGAGRIREHDALGRRLGEWFHDDARERAPSSLLDAVSAGARRLPRRRSWGVALRHSRTGGRAQSRRVVRWLSLLVILGSLLVVGVILVTPERPPRVGVGWLAYVHEGDIYLADSAGSGARRITHADGVTFVNVAWSPDGSRLVAEADSGTILIDPFTGAATFVGGTGPTWSPDGRQLAVVDYPPAGSRLRLVDVATLSTVRTYPVPVGAGLAWSPNGRWIAASGECSGSACPPDSSGQTTALIRIDVATGEVVQLDQPAGQFGASREPAWSPDSRRIAFVRWDIACGGFRGSGGCGSDVFVADADGSNSRQLNRVVGHADQPAWSPDGSWISWRSIDKAGSGRRDETSRGITLEHPDGTGERLIAGAGTVGYSWGPGSDRVWLAVQASGSSAAILWEAPLIDPPSAIDVSLDPASDYEPWGLSFDWQSLVKGRTAAALPSPPAPTAPADLAQVTPAPAAGANPGKRWPTLRTIGQDSCSLVSVSIGSPDVTTIATFCDLTTNGWSGGWSPTGSAFALVHDGILTMYQPDGNQTRIIIDVPGIDGVGWSPDGGWLSISAGPSAYILRPDGSSLRQVPGGPSWSPDGRTMAITRPDGVLLVGSAEGPGLVALGSIPGPTAWAPDGSRFAFVRDGNLWTVAIDGSDARNVTALPLGGASWATWSPDGRWIAVSAFHGVWLVPSNGGDKTWLDFGRSSSVSTVVWSPDSRRVAIETYPRTPDGQPPDSGQTSAIYLADPDGSPTIRIDNAAGPNWSPDGLFLLVADQQLGGGDTGTVAIMNADGSGRTDLRATSTDARSIVWAR